MNVDQMLVELRAERAQIEQAILVLEKLATGSVPRRGRPPGWLKSLNGTPTSTPRQRRPMSAETRAKMAAAQKKRWAAARQANEG